MKMNANCVSELVINASQNLIHSKLRLNPTLLQELFHLLFQICYLVFQLFDALLCVCHHNWVSALPGFFFWLLFWYFLSLPLFSVVLQLVVVFFEAVRACVAISVARDSV